MQVFGSILSNAALFVLFALAVFMTLVYFLTQKK
jgi:hypothetical protein